MKHTTSWQKVGKWYNKLVEDKGHYYHEHVIIPGVLKFLNLKPNDSLLDVGCGQGVLARQIPKNVYYQGIDNAPTLIESAKRLDKNQSHHYSIADATNPLPFEKHDFTHSAIVLALQNMENPEIVFQNISRRLVSTGKLVIVLNHPMFRIPRQSSWGIDEANKLQYRRINRYLSPLKIPITMHPGQSVQTLTWSFHHPLSDYSKFLKNTGFLIELIEEWTSTRESLGSAAKMENRGRAEIPLFMAILAQKIRVGL